MRMNSVTYKYITIYTICTIAIHIYTQWLISVHNGKSSS